MSSNNVIIVKQTKSGYVVTIQDIETGCGYDKPIKCKTLKEAVRKAQEICDTELVEYGIQFELL